MANLTKCMICGKQYTYCPNCANTHGWRFYTDSYEHYQIYMAITQYKDNFITKEEVRATLNRLGIKSNSDLGKFKPNIAEYISKILAVEEKPETKTLLKKTRKSKLYNEE